MTRTVILLALLLASCDSSPAPVAAGIEGRWVGEAFNGGDGRIARIDSLDLVIGTTGHELRGNGLFWIFYTDGKKDQMVTLAATADVIEAPGGYHLLVWAQGSVHPFRGRVVDDEFRGTNAAGDPVLFTRQPVASWKR